jgi:hypothetical protein
MSAHSVRHRPKPAVGADGHRVFIHFPAKADMGFADAFKGHERFPLLALNPP